MEVSVLTHVGHYRQVNEDSGEVIKRGEDILLAILADGMGGHQAGDVASQMAVSSIKQSFDQVDFDKNVQEWEDWLLQAIREANRSIYRCAMQNEAHYGMGTTIVAALCLKEHYLIAHVGDSRVYRFAEKKLEIITEDHSLVNELVRSGQITKEQALTHPQRSAITRALGTEEYVEIDVQTRIYLDGEQILLCSDGLSDMVGEEKIKHVLEQSYSQEKKAEILLQSALDAGGDDNITLILLHKTGESGRK